MPLLQMNKPSPINCKLIKLDLDKNFIIDLNKPILYIYILFKF